MIGLHGTAARTCAPSHRKTVVTLENWGVLVCFLPNKLHITFLNLVHFNFLTALASSLFTNTVCSCFFSKLVRKEDGNVSLITLYAYIRCL